MRTLEILDRLALRNAMGSLVIEYLGLDNENEDFPS
jgi:hypothetical protein